MSIKDNTTSEEEYFPSWLRSSPAREVAAIEEPKPPRRPPRSHSQVRVRDGHGDQAV